MTNSINKGRDDAYDGRASRSRRTERRRTDEGRRRSALRCCRWRSDSRWPLACDARTQRLRSAASAATAQEPARSASRSRSPPSRASPSPSCSIPNSPHGMFMGERWVSPPTYFFAQDGPRFVVQAKAQNIDSRRHAHRPERQLVGRHDPSMITVAPGNEGQVTIVVSRPGDGHITVATGAGLQSAAGPRPAGRNRHAGADHAVSGSLRLKRKRVAVEHRREALAVADQCFATEYRGRHGFLVADSTSVDPRKSNTALSPE